MQTWARRGIQTALVTGGLLMLGTGIASADEDVNPDKPASPLDLEPRLTFALGEGVLREPLHDVKTVTEAATEDVAEDVPAVYEAVDEFADAALDREIRGDLAVPVEHDGQQGGQQGGLQGGLRDDESVLDWVAPVRFDGGSLALTDRGPDAGGTIADPDGLAAGLLNPRELADLDKASALLRHADLDVAGTAEALRDEVVDTADALFEATRDQNHNVHAGLLSGGLSPVPPGEVMDAVGDVTEEVGGKVVLAARKAGLSATGGEGGVMSEIVNRAPLGGGLPVFDVPADVLARALSTTTARAADLGDTPAVHLPVGREEALPNRLPSLLPLGPAPTREHQGPVALDDVAGVFSGVIDTVTETLSAERTEPRNLPGLTPGTIGPISGDLFDEGPAKGLPIVGDLLGDPLGGNLLGGLLGNQQDGAPQGGNAQSGPLGDNPLSGLLGRNDLLGNVSDTAESTGLTGFLLSGVTGAQPTPRDLPAIVPEVTNDLDVTKIVPTIPSLQDVRSLPALAGPVLAKLPSVDGTLTDTREALASLFTNHPIG